MYIYKNHCFLAHPRAAARTVGKTLIDLGWEQVGGQHMGPPEFSVKDYQTFCVVRNHWEAICSWLQWWTGRKELITPEKIASLFTTRARKHVEPGHLWYFRYRAPETRVIRYEHLNKELKYYLNNLGFDMPKLPRLGDGETNARNYAHYYTREARDFVYLLFHKEIDYYGYSFNG